MIKSACSEIGEIVFLIFGAIKPIILVVEFEEIEGVIVGNHDEAEHGVYHGEEVVIIERGSVRVTLVF